MLSEKEENIFRDIIQSVDYERAPEGLKSNVLQQLAKERSLVSRKNEALIPKWFSVVVIMALVGLLWYINSTNVESELSIISYVSTVVSSLSFDYSFRPELNLSALTVFTLCCLIPTLFIQMFFIKQYYERS